MPTLGPAYDPNIDKERLRKQHETIRNYMLDGCWRTLHEISEALKYPESSVSAQLRHLRKKQFGSYIVNKRRRVFSTGVGGTWEYQVVEPAVEGWCP